MSWITVDDFQFPPGWERYAGGFSFDSASFRALEEAEWNKRSSSRSTAWCLLPNRPSEFLNISPAFHSQSLRPLERKSVDKLSLGPYS